MLPNKEQLRQAVHAFGIVEEVENFYIRTNMQEERNGKKAFRIVIEVRLENQKKLIVRFLNERAFIMDISHLRISTDTLERQSEFSEILRKNGMLVPQKYSKNGKYCIQMFLDDTEADVTVEEYLGKPLEKFSEELFPVYGELLGKMHKISLDHKIHIGFSIVFDEVMENRTNYKNLFTGCSLEDLDNQLLKKIIRLHDIKKEKILSIWNCLPKAAVQGDIYSCNNVALLPEGIGFYDFNIAADEVLLGDFLHLWFRTLYDVENEDLIKEWDLNICWKNYLSGYEKYRQFTQKEREIFSLVYSVLGSIYMTRYLVELLRRNRRKDAQKCLKDVYEILNSNEEGNML